MKNRIDYDSFIIASYGVPFASSYGLTILVSGHSMMGPFHADTIGIQARLIGLWIIVFSLTIMFYVLIKIPKSYGTGRAKIIMSNFLISPFFFVWILTIILDLWTEYLQEGKVFYLLMLIVCFYFQRKFNKKLIEIYNQ